MRKLIIVSVAMFVLGVIVGSAVAVRAQNAPNGNVIAIPTPPAQIHGNDIALKITGRSGKRVVGTFMARVDGKWQEVQIAPQDAWVARP